MPNNNLPTIAQLQDPAWLKSQSQRVQSQVFRATEGRHRAKNDVVKLNSNYVQRRAADKRWRETHPDLYLQQQQQPPAATTTTGGNTTSNGGGGQGQNVRFDQRISKFDRARGTSAGGVTQSGTPLSDQRDATAEARDSAATTTPRPSTGGSVIGTTSSMGAANTRSPFNTPATPPAWLTPAPSQPWLPNANTNRNTGNGGGNTPRLPSGLPNGVPNWALPAAPRIPSGLPTNQIPSGIPAPSIPVVQGPRLPRQPNTGGAIGVPGGLSQSQQQANMPRLQAMGLSYPANVMQGGSYVPSYNGGPGGTYTDPNGRRYYVTGSGQFMYMGDPSQAVVGQPAISQAAQNLRYMATYSPMGVLPSTPSTFGSYYGGGFGGGYGGGGGGGYTSYDPYNSNPSWYNNMDLTAWNIQ